MKSAMKIVLYGPPETLKTRMALALARHMAGGGRPILLVDAEAGFGPAADLPALRVVSYDDVPQGRQARNGPYAFAHRARAAIDEFITTGGPAPPVLVIDSLSVLQKRLIAAIEESTAPDDGEPTLDREIDAVNPTSLFNYRVSARILRQLLNHAFALRGPYVIVAHERQDTVEAADPRGRKTSITAVGPDLQKSIAGLVLAHADIVAHTARRSDGRVLVHVGAGGLWENPRTYIVTKDRFRQFPEPGALNPRDFLRRLTEGAPAVAPTGGTEVAP